MSRIHVTQYNSRALDTFVAATKSREVRQLIADAVGSTPYTLQAAENLENFHDSFVKDGFRLGILELGLAGERARDIQSEINRIYPHAGIIVIAENLDEAMASGINISGCVQHLFLERPSVEHLRDFLIAIQVK